MRSEWRMWPDEMKITWPIPGGQAFALYQAFGGDTVEHDDGTWSPAEFTYVEMPSSPDLPYFVMECDSTPEGVPRIIAVQAISRHPRRDVRTADLRRLRLEDALEAAWEQVTRRPSVVNEGVVSPTDAVTRLTTPDLKMLRGLRAHARARLDPDIHKEVARVYTQALSSGAPTKAVAEHFKIAPSTASLYVKRARDAGALEPASPTGPSGQNSFEQTPKRKRGR